MFFSHHLFFRTPPHHATPRHATHLSCRIVYRRDIYISYIVVIQISPVLVISGSKKNTGKRTSQGIAAVREKVVNFKDVREKWGEI